MVISSYNAIVGIYTVGYARTNVIGSRISLVIASVLTYIEIYVFRGNPFQAQSLQQSYHPAVSLSFAGSWLKLYSRIIIKNIFTAKGAYKQITELN
jgi:hypothetical protein